MRKVDDPAVMEFVKKVKERFPDAKIILFGSRARGDALKESDYDFIVISKSFKNVPFYERPTLLYELWEGSTAIDLLCYTPEEFEKKKKQICVVREAVKEGIEL